MNEVLPRFPSINSIPSKPLELLKQFSHFRILTPFRKGLLGVESLNQIFLQQILLREKRSESIVLPIMIVQNDQRLGLFNGEIGLLIKHQNKPDADFAIFASKESLDDVRKIPFLLLPKFEYAYCLSIHKSQGSEFNHVLIVLPEGSEYFGRETLYTGTTRAKQSLELWGEENIIRKMIKKVSYRNSGVFENLSKSII